MSITFRQALMSASQAGGLLVHLLERADDAVARIVDQHVDAAPCLVEVTEHVGDGVRRADIGFDGDGLAAVLLECINKRVSVLGMRDVIDADLGAGRAERPHHGGAKSRIAAGDEYPPAVEIDPHGASAKWPKHRIGSGSQGAYYRSMVGPSRKVGRDMVKPQLPFRAEAGHVRPPLLRSASVPSSSRGLPCRR
jgi:hypothetical protein